MLPIGVVSHLRHRDYLGGLEVTVGVMDGGEETPPNAVRLHGVGVPPRGL